MYCTITYSVPYMWAELLRQVQKQAPEAFIAGGCLRDHFNHAPVNDLDIFVPESKPIDVSATHPQHVKSIPEPYLTHDNDVRSIEYFADPSGLLPPVNLIGVSDHVCTPWDQLERFDFGICKVGYDGDQLYMASDYGRDVKQKTFTLKRGQTDEQLAYSLERFTRISAKYPGWTLVRPDYGLL